MTVNELHKVCKSPIKVLSSYSGHVMCRRFNPEKHIEIGKKEVLDFWADAELNRLGFSPSIYPIICVYASEFED